MELEHVHEQLREKIATSTTVDVASPVQRTIARVAPRYLLPRAQVPGVSIHTVKQGPARLRLFRPATSGGAGLVWIHSGGMVIGAPQQDDLICARTAAELGITVASADYRLAPRHPYPTPPDDCLAVWDWLQDHATDLGLDRDRIAVGGGSAGGGLAATIINRIHDRGGVQPAAQWLLYPMLDDRTAAQEHLDVHQHFVWDNVANRVGWGAYLASAGEPGADGVPADAAPARREDLSGLPPAWIGVGDIDLFHDEDVTYAQRLREAGVPVQLDVVQGAPHGFDEIVGDAPVTREFAATARSWLADVLGGTRVPA